MKLSAFSINTLFIVLMLVGIALIPKLSLQLMPSSRSNELSVSFSWANANPEMLEMEVTSKLEGAFSRIKGLNRIHSQTGQGYGTIILSIDKNENIDATKLHVSSLVRSLVKSLPEGVRVSAVQGGEIQEEGGQEEERRLLHSYTITGPGSSQDVATFAEDHIVPAISQIADIEQVSVTGAVPFEWVLYYDEQLLQDLNISPYEISSAINRYYSSRDGGKVLVENTPVEKYSYIVFKGYPAGKDIDFLELRACDHSCSGGALTINNRFLTIERLQKRKEQYITQHLTSVNKMPQYAGYLTEQMQLVGDILPRPIEKLDEDMTIALQKMEKISRMMKVLPQVDCGACGAPSCRVLAQDIVQDKAKLSQCVFLQKVMACEGLLTPEESIELAAETWGSEKFENYE